MQYWLMKSEPDTYSIDDLKKDGRAEWDGIRNYQARNFMRDSMSIGDQVLFYHSNTQVPGVVGLAEVCSAPYPDPTQFNVQSKYFDSKSSTEKPRWVLVDVCFKTLFDNVVTLRAIKADPFFEEMLLVKKGQRLSIQPVEKKHFERILALGSVVR